MNLPSKKIIVFGIVCIAIVGTIVYFQTNKNLGISSINDTGDKASQEKISTYDAIRKKIVNSASGSSTQVVDSLTTKIAQEAATNLLSLQQNGQLSSSSLPAIANNISSYATSSPLSFSLSDVITFSDLDTAKIKDFGNATAKTVMTYSGALQISPIDILAQTKNSSSIQAFPGKLLPMSNAYRSIVLGLIKIPAPISLAGAYLEFVNNYLRLANDIDNLSAYYSDPVRGLVGITNYHNDSANQINLLKNMGVYFKTNGIMFSNTDSGAVWSSM